MTKTCSVHASVTNTTHAQVTESAPLAQDPQAQERILERYIEKYVDVPMPLFKDSREQLCEITEMRQLDRVIQDALRNIKTSKEQLDKIRLQTEASSDEAVRLLMKAQLT